MKRIKSHIWLCIVCLLTVLFLSYKYAFIRDTTNGKPGTITMVANIINPLPYAEYFYIQQQKPSTFFTTPAFPSYTQWCHENKKLCSVVPLQQLYADTQRIGSIQFVGSQESPNKFLGLSKLLDNLSNLAPYWDYPYAFGQLLIPMTKKQGLAEGTGAAQQSWADAKLLADRGEDYLCDKNLIQKISALDEATFIDTYYNESEKQKLINPCPAYERAHYAAFNAFYYRKDSQESAKNYKISSFTNGSPGLAPIMAALVYGRGGEHIKSASIWYDKYVSLAANISTISNPDPIIVKETEEALKKSVFELQLQLITDADDMTEKKCNKSYDCLQKGGYIKKSVQKSYNDICKKGREDNNLRCVLLAIGIDNKWITLDGGLIYPLMDGFRFAWSNEYESWWIQGKKINE